MDPACSVCLTIINHSVDSKKEGKEYNPLLQAFKAASSPEARKHAFNLLDMFLAANSTIEFPLCRDCSNRAKNDMKRAISDLENECLKYDEALQDLTTKRNITAYDADSMRNKLQQLCLEEEELEQELKRLEEQEKKINNDYMELQKQRNDVGDKSDAMYRELRINHRKLIECNEDSFSLTTQAKYINDQLNHLTSVNVLDMTFLIHIQDQYGTINGLRLGRLPHELVEWNEINAAFGQIALLIQVLAERLNIVFVDYEIEPKGNNSYVHKLSGGKKVTYPLFGQGGWKPFGQIQLDHAIVGLINCFLQLELKLREIHKNKELLIYRIDGDRIIENDSPYRIKMQFNSEERWTKAMKLFLLNLKRIIGLLPTVSSKFDKADISYMQIREN